MGGRVGYIDFGDGLWNAGVLVKGSGGIVRLGNITVVKRAVGFSPSA